MKLFAIAMLWGWSGMAAYFLATERFLSLFVLLVVGLLILGSIGIWFAP